jgi:hypothetical protein
MPPRVWRTSEELGGYAALGVIVTGCGASATGTEISTSTTPSWTVASTLLASTAYG